MFGSVHKVATGGGNENRAEPYIHKAVQGVGGSRTLLILRGEGVDDADDARTEAPGPAEAYQRPEVWQGQTAEEGP